jgi:hypothetical protein
MPSRTRAFYDADTSTDEFRGPLSRTNSIHIRNLIQHSICPDRIGVIDLVPGWDRPGVAGSTWARNAGLLKSWSNGYTTAAGRS